jgi:hypothetical protein
VEVGFPKRSCSYKEDHDPAGHRVTIWSDGLIMRHAFAIAVAGVSLAGCSSFSTDYFKPAPPTLQLQLESNPPGADARTSLGPGCKTPCAVRVTAPAEGALTVSYTLNRFEPVTIPVQVMGSAGNLLASGTQKFEPNPVVAELRPIGPPPKPSRKMMRPKRQKKPQTNGDTPPPAGSAIPEPGQAPPSPAR